MIGEIAAIHAAREQAYATLGRYAAAWLDGTFLPDGAHQVLVDARATAARADRVYDAAVARLDTPARSETPDAG